MGPPGDPLLVYKYSEYQNKGVDIVKTHVTTQSSQHKFAHTQTPAQGRGQYKD